MVEVAPAQLSIRTLISGLRDLQARGTLRVTEPADAGWLEASIEAVENELQPSPPAPSEFARRVAGDGEQRP